MNSEVSFPIIKKRKRAETNVSLPKARRIRKETRKWLYAEELLILEYIIASEKKGYEFEKPTAGIYYDRLLEKLLLNKINVGQIKNKMANLRTKFIEAQKWENGTGQGVDVGTIEEHSIAMCPHYKLLKEIFGHRKNFMIAFAHDNLEPGADKINVNQDLIVVAANQGNTYDDIHVVVQDAVNNTNNDKEAGNVEQIDSEFISDDYDRPLDDFIFGEDELMTALHQETTDVSSRISIPVTTVASVPVVSSTIPIRVPFTTVSNVTPNVSGINEVSTASTQIPIVSQPIFVSSHAISQSALQTIPATIHVISTAPQTIPSATQILSASPQVIPTADQSTASGINQRSTARSRTVRGVARLRQSLSCLPQSSNGFQVNERPPNAATVIAKALTQRAEAINRKIEHDALVKMEEHKLKYDLEREMRIMEMDLKRTEIESKERIRMAEIKMNLEINALNDRTDW